MSIASGLMRRPWSQIHFIHQIKISVDVLPNGIPWALESSDWRVTATSLLLEPLSEAQT